MKYEITEEQIKELAKGNAKVKKWFPEVFELKREKGKWYKCVLERGSLFECLGNGRARGFFQGREWTDDWAYPGSENLRLATDTEVLEALTNEAKKRGFKCAKFIKSAYNDKVYEVTGDRFYLDKDGDFVFGEIIIMKNGIWAKIIKTYTKEEAEKMLNAKII